MKKAYDLGREELYNLVWSEAMATLAPKLGISDVGLKKRFANQGVPTPPRGYWAKLEAGKRVTKPKLPANWTKPEVKKKRIPKTADEVRKFPIPERDYSIAKPAPILVNTRRLLKSGKPGDYGTVDVGGPGALRTHVSKESIERAMWLWSELIKSLKERGVAFTPESSEITNGNAKVFIELKEMAGKFQPDKETLKQQGIRLTRMYYNDDYVPPMWVSTGILVFRALDADHTGCSHQWRESELRRMEDRLAEVVDGIVRLLERLHEMAIERAERERQRAIEQKLWEEEERKRRNQQARLRKLIRLTASFSESEQFRRLASEVESRGQDVDGVDDFLVWIRRYADSLDPVNKMLKELAEGRDPVEPESDDLYPPRPRTWG